MEGVPAGLTVTAKLIQRDLDRRRRGYGRGGRMAIEDDAVRILAGVRQGRTLGTPIALLVENRDYEAWRPVMQPEPLEQPPGAAAAQEPGARITVPRPGHADLAGLAKYRYSDIRDVLERASARETVCRVAAGAVARTLLEVLRVTIAGRVTSVGEAADESPVDLADPASIDWHRIEESPLGILDVEVERRALKAVDDARAAGESLGGVFEVWAWGVVPGLGGYATAAERLDGRLMGAVGAIPAVKGVEIGLGFECARRSGSQVHDPVARVQSEGTWVAMRPTNRAGGLEGGVTNGCPIVVRAAMKPIPTLTRPLPSLDLDTMRPAPAHKERSDIMAVPAARVVGEAVVALELASAYLEKFGGDTVADLVGAVALYEQQLKERGLWARSLP